MISTRQKADPSPTRSQRIRVFNRQRKHRLDLPWIRRVAAHVAQALGLEQQEIGIIFIGDRKMSRLNRQYRGKSGSTDVLSFGQTGIADYLGDVFISVETASVNAFRAGHSLRQETAILVLHGLLHLTGYDHETDQGEMKALERKMRRSRLLHAGS